MCRNVQETLNLTLNITSIYPKYSLIYPHNTLNIASMEPKYTMIYMYPDIPSCTHMYIKIPYKCPQNTLNMLVNIPSI